MHTLIMSHGQGNAEIESDGSPSLTCNHEAPILFSCKDYGNGAAEGISPTLRSLNHKDGNANGGSHMAIAFQPRFYTRDNKTGGAPMETAEISNCKKAGDSAPLIATPNLVRRLTPLECERLQGLPDGWTLGFADSTRYRMIGNGVAVPVFEWFARRILKFAKPANDR